MAKFPIDVTARDKTGDTIKKIGEAFSRLAKGGPFEKLSHGFETWSKSSRSMGEAWKAIGSLGDSATGAAGGLGEAAEGASALAVGVGAATLGVGLLAIGLGKVAQMGVDFADKWSQVGRGVAINSRLIGLSFRDLQTLQGAGALEGVKPEQMTVSLQGLGQILEDAHAGRNNAALALWNQLGLKIKFLKNGAVDTKAAMIDLAGAMERQTPQVREFIAMQFGVAGAMPFLGRGRAQVLADMETYTRSHAAMTEAQIQQSERFQRSLTQLGEHWDAFKNNFAQKLVIPWAQPLIDTLSGALDDVNKLIGAWSKLQNAVGGHFDLGNPAENVGAAIGAWVADHFRRGVAGAGAQAAPAPVDTSSIGRGGPGSPAAGASAAPAAGPWGVKRNNPGNIRPTSGVGFRSFGSFDEGVRAMGRQLQIYAERHGLDTIAGIVSRWAPPGDRNNTPAYIADVARRAGFDPAQHLNLHDPAILSRLEAAMIRHEQGRDVISPGQVQAMLAGGAGRSPAPQTAGGRARIDLHIHGAPKGAIATAQAPRDFVADIGLALETFVI